MQDKDVIRPPDNQQLSSATSVEKRIYISYATKEHLCAKPKLQPMTILLAM